MTFVSAKGACHDKGATLVVIDSEEKQKLVDDLFSSVRKYWLALEDRCTGVGMKCLKWYRGDGSRFELDYTNWLEGEPNNEGQRYKCAWRTSSNGKYGWQDVFTSDGEKTEVICQKSRAGRIMFVH